MLRKDKNEVKLNTQCVAKSKYALKGKDRKKIFWCYLILTPALIGFLVFSLYPMLWAAQKAFYYYNGVPSETHFTGVENFIKIFTTDETYWLAWKNTFIFTIGKLPLELPLAMLIAVCLQRKLRGTGFFRTVYFMPCIIGAAIIGVMLTNMFDYFGFINAWLIKAGLIEEPIAWFSDSKMAMTALVIGSVWNTFGTNVLYFMAAMSNIDESLYESAVLDGAGAWTKFRKITLPMMGPVLQVILLLSINGTVHTRDYILTTTNGGPAGSTYTVMAYQVGKFVPGFAETGVNIGYGCAMSIVTSALMIIIALLYMKLSKKMQDVY